MITPINLLMTPILHQLDSIAPCTAVEDPIRPGRGLTFFVRIGGSDSVTAVGRLEVYFAFLEGLEHQVGRDEGVKLALQEK